jgi:hypothetical protein
VTGISMTSVFVTVTVILPRPDLSDSEGVPEAGPRPITRESAISKAGPRPITRESAISISPVSQFRDRHFHDIGFRDSDGALIWPR